MTVKNVYVIWPCQARTTLFYINSNETFTVTLIISVVEVVMILMIHINEYVFQKKQKKMNIIGFNLMTSVNETRFLVQRGSNKCKYRFNENVCNSK